MNYNEFKFPELDMSEENLKLLLDIYERSNSGLFLCNFLRLRSFAKEHLNEEIRHEMLDTIADSLQRYTGYYGSSLEEAVRFLNEFPDDFFEDCPFDEEREIRIYWLNHEINRVRNLT